MQQLILNPSNSADFLLIVQLAKRLGIVYMEREGELPPNFYPVVQKTEVPENITQLAKPLRKIWDLAEIKQEQNYKGVNRQRWDELIDSLDIQENMEDLIAQL